MRSRKTFWLTAMLLALVFAAPATAAPQIAIGAPDPAVQAKVQALDKEVRAGGHSFRVGYSSAMDRPISKLAGFKEPPGWLNNAYVDRHIPLGAAALPSSFDWRTQNGVTPIKNQQSCGDCWAFGTVAPLESQILLQCGITVDLSEQFLTSCNLDNWSCSGGFWAHDYHMNKLARNQTTPGAVLESSFPYTATNGTCGVAYNHPYRITNWAYIAGQPIPSVQAIKQAIYSYGPVSAAVYVGPKFQGYSSGVFNANETGQVNHAIALVGWNDDLGPDNGYWILRNSWGAGWGESGYMRIRYGCNKVGYSANYIQFACPNSSPPPAPPALPDLKGSISSLTVYPNGYRVAGKINVSNIGQAAAGSFNTLLYLSNDGAAKTLYLGNVTVSGLAAGASTSISFNKTSSPTLFSGKYLLVIIDSDSQVKESNETNNNVVKLVP
jgi:hypothetical protein